MAEIRIRYLALRGVLNERTLRLWAGAEARAVGQGIRLVAEATGLSRATVRRGFRDLQELEDNPPAGGSEQQRIRRPGSGRPSVAESQPGLLEALERLIDPSTRGDPESALRWTCKSTRLLSEALEDQGYEVSHTTVSRLLRAQGYSLQAMRKTLEGSSHPDRDGQFLHISEKSKTFLAAGDPVISVDTKKKELIGKYRNGGQEWQPEGSPEPALVHDFIDRELGKAIPYGVYDVGRNEGWVSVGRDHDTAEFAVESIRRWWDRLGREAYPNARRLLIVADAGGSNGYRTRLWRTSLQKLADELDLELSVSHLPPGTSKWNKIEHRMFCHISQNWRGRPLISHEVVIELIAATSTQNGLRIQAELDHGTYPKGKKVSDEEWAAVLLECDKFHGDWNYTIRANKSLHGLDH